MTIDLSLIKTLVEAAQHAPSGDNCQPLRYVWKAPVLEIYDSPERGQGFLNTDNFGTWAAFGAALKNMEIIASGKGVKIIRTLFPSGIKMAELRFENKSARPDPLASVIDVRVVNRKPYKTTKLSPNTKRALAGATSGLVKMDYVEGGPAFNLLVDGSALGDSFSIFDKRIHSYLFRWLRWSRESAEKTRDGMPVQTMELNVFDQVNLWLMRSWTWVRAVSFVGAKHIFVTLRKKVYRRSAGFGVLTVEKWTPESIVAVGEIMQTLWLKATELKLAFHAMMGLAMMIQIDKSGHETPFPSSESKALRKIASDLKRALPSLENREVAFLFRRKTLEFWKNCLIFDEFCTLRCFKM
jgi:hypothetical protein